MPMKVLHTLSMKMLMLLLMILLVLSAVGCANTSSNTLIRSQVTYLEKNDKAPYEGFLLTKRVLAIMYKDAEKQNAEDTAKSLREKYE